MAQIPDTDQALLMRVRRAADAPAFAAFYRRYDRLVLAYFVRRTPSPEVAADLTMEVFAAALHSAQAGTGPLPGTPAAWLFGIARNKLADSYRQHRTDSQMRTRLGMEPVWLDDEDLRRIDELTDERRVMALLDALPADQQRAVWGFVIEDRTHAAVAAQLGCSELVIRQRVSRGLCTLRNLLETPK
jgi:RNA polymerase sigma-70 factor (ECF subfamily)